ncbi:hypothetical protein EDF54_0978 [Rathayibacter sp. PhB93]|uniref:hypothetical protein n=1 Tax=unclassified Rathayibacter TaxID=2609250 RepID=UPI000F48FAE0|nr:MULTISPECIES: hypothetical protein [unclassified Rathayibacter]ROQ16098.1 hypothetical protein EDF54_0978 [Rathayibacter sp. PhB93]TDQ16039.1 hypothetical protein EDF17_0723 [Rathayibacter sp. PhB1]
MSAPTPAPARRRFLTPRRVALLAALTALVVGLALLGLVALQYSTLAAQGFDDVCLAGVGRVPAEEGSLVAGSWSWWPLGGTCRWELLDGTVVDSAPDWSTTAVAITGAALALLGVVGTALALLVRRRAR